MNKMDMLRNMREVTEEHTSPTYQRESEDLSEESLQRLEAQMRVQCLQDEAKIKNTQELIQLLKKLQGAISQSVGNVETAARQVRAYPDEAVGRCAARMEQCLAQCEAAAKKSRENFETTQKVLGQISSEYLWINVFVATGAAMGMGIGLVTLSKLIFG